MIPGALRVHAREVWQDPRYPVFGPADDPRNNDTAVIHYTGSDNLIDGDPGESATDLPQYLRNIQKSYVLNRGYSIGYLWAVDWLGGIWQLRGWEYQSAANKDHNNHTVPILVLVDGQDAATDEAVMSVRHIIAEAERRSGRTFTIVGHGQLSGAATSCPGVGLRSQVNAGVFSPTLIPKPDPSPIHPIVRPPSPDLGGHSVFTKLIRLDGSPAVYAVYSGGYKVWVRTEAELAAFRSLGAAAPEVIPASLESLFAITGPVFGPLPPGVDSHGVPV